MFQKRTKYAGPSTLTLLLSVIAAMCGIAFLGMQYAYAVITEQLDRGERGSEVTELQEFLADRPSLYPSGLVTGYFGPLTEEGVQNFQASQGIVSSGSPHTTGYGRVGPITMQRINAIMGGGGTGGSADVNAPVMLNDSVTVEDTEATITWATNNQTQSRVMYSTSWPFLYETAASASADGYSQTPTVTLTGLEPNTTYYYVRESIDVAGNLSWTTADTFTTE